MRGLVVIGSGPDAAETAVAARACTFAIEAGMTPAVMVATAVGRTACAETAELAHAAGGDEQTLSRRSFEVAAPPVVAARHAGAVIEPAALVAEARELADGADLV